MKSVKSGILSRRGIFSLAVLTLLMVTAGCAGTKKGSQASGKDALFAGTWEGSFETYEFPGSMKLVIDWNGETWSGSLEVTVGLDTATGPIEDFKSEGDTFSFHFFATGPDVLIMGTIEKDKMTGIIEVYVEEDKIDEGTFQCIRR